MKKKILIVLSLIAIMTVLFAISVSAAEPVETWDISATENDNVTAYLYNDTENDGGYNLTIRGVGKMKNWKDSLEYPYDAIIKSVVIEQGVTNICEWAFDYCFNLSNVEIPSSVSTIAENAFFACSGLKNISVDINNATYESMDGNLYTKGGKTLIQYATAKEDVFFAIPDSVDTISGGAFYDCGNLQTIKIGEGITTIDGEFHTCWGLREIIIPSGVTNIRGDAFWRYGIENIVVDENNPFYKSVDGNLYTKDGKTLMIYASKKDDTFFAVPDGVINIPYGAFSEACSLTSVEIPNSVAYIEGSIFYSCYELTVIYAEAESQPIGWDSYWNIGCNYEDGSNKEIPVVWNYKNTIKNDVFTFKGYSFGALGQISFGFDIDYEAKALYEELTGDTLEMGVVFTGYDNLGGKQPLDEIGNAIKLDKGLVVKADLSDYTYSSYDFMLFDITDSISDIKLVIAAYIYDGDVVKYVQENGLSDTVSGISYNEAKESVVQ